MRRIISFLLVSFSLIIVSNHSAMAQYGNEWIDYNKTYWKFKVGTEGLFRINKASLDAAGVPSSASGADYVLFRDGKEVTLFVTNSSAFGSSDYIEFYANKNDGQADKELYLGSDKYANDKKSLFNDTASYFLTVDNSKIHNRYATITTPIPGTPPAASAYCWYTTEDNNGIFFSNGKTNAPVVLSASIVISLYSSQFDQGEGYILNWNNSAVPYNLSIAAPNLVSGPMMARLQTASIAEARDSSHKLQLRVNSLLKADVKYGVSDIKHFDISLPASELGLSNTITFTHSQTGIADAFGLPYWRLEYPRDWNFSGADFFKFRLDAKANPEYIEISNFNHGGIAPVLYDNTNNKRYSGDISVAGKTRFYVDASLTATDMILYAASSPKIFSPGFTKQQTFTNYNNSSNQGDYIIISHKNLMKPLGGKNQIDEYKNYRSSALGGNHAVVVADIEELYDQFAFGIYTHPSSIKHFLNFASDKWTTKPQNVFLIGKGVVYTQFKSFASSSKASFFEGIVPTYGSPGADVAFVSDRNNWTMRMNIGRLSAWNASEVATYLNKIKAYEAALVPATFPTPESELWKKQVLHIAGGDRSDPGLQAGTLLPTLANAKTIIEGPKTGAQVTTIAKTSTDLTEVIKSKTIDSLITNGLSMITYYGHGSASALDFNIKDPSEFNSLPKIPIFSAYGCDISTIYETDTIKTITEKYVSAPVSGSVASMASNNIGYTNIHSKYIPILYTRIAQNNYGQTLGDIYKAAHDSCLKNSAEVANQTSMTQTHMESFILQGDPGTHLTFIASKPDYYVGAEALNTIPLNLSTALDSFQVKIKTHNLGRINVDTVQVKVEHINPEGKVVTTKYYEIQKMPIVTTQNVWLPLDKIKDLGVNKIRVTIDANAKYDESSEANNVATIDVFVLSDNIVPVYPYNFSIVYSPDLTLKASTLNPFKGISKYKIEIDTTELFNSPSRLQTNVESRGGLIKWKPSIVMQDSTVYYWRTSLDSSVNGNYSWTSSSFIYLKNGSAGWNQSHYFQYLYNSFNELYYPPTRKFSYGKYNETVRIYSTIMNLPAPYVNYFFADDNRVFYRGTDFQRYDCSYVGTIQFMVFDSSTGNPWSNPPTGIQGSNPQCGFFARNVNCFSFNINTADSRNNARKFLDSIPNGNFIVVRNCIAANLWGNYYVDTWKADTSIYGSGKSLYHSMRNHGFDKIDSFYQMRVFSMICKKGYTDYPVQQNFAAGINDILDTNYLIPVSEKKGEMNGIVVGPATTWKTLKWRISGGSDSLSKVDSAAVKITGIDKSNNETVLYEGNTTDTNLNFIDASVFPKIKLRWFNSDTLYHTTPQLDFWRVLYDPLPEAALNPSAHYQFTDSVSVGELMKFETTVETLTDLPMDSMLVRYKIIDANGVSHLIGDTKYRKLNGNDTLHTSLSFDPKPYPGKNYIYIEANPDNNQPEQYHPNNLGFLPFTIKTDNYNPLLDVTFDGNHILDRDIISSKPFIKVMLRDENKIVALKDTSTMKLFLRYPNDPANTRRLIPFDGTVCKFIPADVSAGKNEAAIEFRPNFTEDGIYQLYTSGKDVAGNVAGSENTDYSISFEVINKSTITNLLNYPNPFSTSTAFVFTLTGYQIPSQFKIQILSVTGKVVREITKQELGNIHIGRNVTEYKWDGKDQYGQVLGNGVYLYRVVTAINGETIEHRENQAVDKFYKNGYSKMYIMR